MTNEYHEEISFGELDEQSLAKGKFGSENKYAISFFTLIVEYRLS